MRLLIISDLHIGLNAITRELCPYPEGEHKDEQLVNDFIKYSKQYIQRSGKFDYLIIPGDITNKSNLIEYNCGVSFLNRILKELDIEQKKVIFVPGNHDVDWSVLAGVPEEEIEHRRPHKWNTLRDKNHVFSELSGISLLEDPYFSKWEFSNVIFFGFNSSWHDDSQNAKHYGQILPHQIEALRLEFEKSDLNKLKIFVVHHHLHQFENPHPSWIDISIMQNSQALLNLLAEYSFNFVIHGHRHLPNFLSTTIENFAPLNILCSGSYSCEVPTDIAGYVGNLFHIIEVDEYSVDECKGNVFSMAYDRRIGWIKSSTNHGIEHINPFGIRESLSKITLMCIAEIESLLANNAHIFYSHLESVITDLNYLPLLSKKRLINDLQDKCKVIFFTNDSETVIIKNNAHV